MINEADRWKKGKSYRRYCYTLKDIAKARGVSVFAVRKAVSRLLLDPMDIKSIARYVLRQKGDR